MRHYAKRTNGIIFGRVKGQTLIETAFVFSSLILLSFALVNLAILLHTKNIATYAAFMAARSYQVLGNQVGAEFFMEVGKNGGTTPFLSDLRILGTVRVAEDIFTCALPWMEVPEGDGNLFTSGNLSERTSAERCKEGDRRYDVLNVGKNIRFATFEEEEGGGFGGAAELEIVSSAFAEPGRVPLRFGIMNLRYRTPIVFDPLGVFTENFEDNLVRDEVFVPVLLNPGLLSGITRDQGIGDNDFDDDFK